MTLRRPFWPRRSWRCRSPQQAQPVSGLYVGAGAGVNYIVPSGSNGGN